MDGDLTEISSKRKEENNPFGVNFDFLSKGEDLVLVFIPLSSA